MNDEDIAKTLEGYRHEIGSLKHRMDEVEQIVGAVHVFDGQADGRNQTHERIDSAAQQRCGRSEGEAGESMGSFN